MDPLEQLRRGLAGFRPRRLQLPDERRAAVSAILRSRPEGPELLFIRRAEHPDDPWSGHMAFPGGRVDGDDDGGLAAAVRETQEEIGVDLSSNAERIGRLSDLQAMSRGRRLALVIEPYVFELHREVVISPDPREVQEALWIPISVLGDPSQRSSMLWRKAVPLPCVRYEGRKVWGLTLRMVDELLEVGRTG